MTVEIPRPALPTAEEQPTGNAKLGPVSDRGMTECVVFRYNPSAVSIVHGMTGRDLSASKLAEPHGSPVLGGPKDLELLNGKTIITISRAVFNGDTVPRDCLRLLNWSYAVKERTEKPENAVLPFLRFTWAQGPDVLLGHDVLLDRVTVNFTRFTSSGTPVRAAVDLTMHVIPQDRPGTNPTSGGPAGRRTHLVTGDENLPQLALRTYGSASRWREIATANGIHDPLRVPPGTRLYLPSTQESEG
ncbi:hypothetical protein [Kitasatospora viridis]|uniref:LysM domain-containing protein n=1 Tax=Kitasatospora viridis TaxID=281105 RepID=A0A561TV48_9ACTN|nr:hypothetical protein [Kitasatospora viridis]TWF90987.1 hypothetical protein FHX73_1299 [Kitasatospora viridis]